MLKDIFKGISAYFGAFSLLSKLKLWQFFAIPIAISIVTAAVIGFAAYGLSDNIGAIISKAWIWDWGHETFSTIGTVMGGLIAIAIGLILYKHIVMALSAPFMGPVSEKIETSLSTKESNHIHPQKQTPFMKLLWRGVRINIRNLIRELLFTIPILLLGFVPLIGVVSPFILFIVQAYYVGFGNMDYTLERHFSYRDSISFVKKNRGVAIGNGIVFILFLLIPIIGFILVLPLSVTAASKETVNALNRNKF